LIVRSKPAFDGSIPSGNSVACRNLLRLYHYTENAGYLERADTMLRLYADQMRQQPFGFANMLCTVDFYTQKPREIVVIARSDATEAAALLERIRRTYLPNRTLTVADPAGGGRVPSLLAGKGQLDGKPTAFVCRNLTCSPPVTEWVDLEPLLLR